MARKGPIKKKIPAPDTKYSKVNVSKFINSLMLDGKKSTAEAIFYDSLDIIKEKTKSDPIEVFEEAFKNIQPTVEVRSRRVGGATYQVPVEVSSSRKNSLAIRWLLSAARKRDGKSMAAKLASEFMDAKENKGGAAKKKEDTLRMAEANRAFSHYRW
ncbi:MAG: 30S ribosomal protein S7 [Thermodesulfobacteriota bacterium]|jgi:small subunit ribosomal protein S7|nr:30S ribosomal protein S7 [bacterium]MBT3849769.1 30S ribosomal protein S7 [bacterium]MBT4434887.1 30S ribosomal protein S7 [bacterium]MDG2446244.1 30S ribosomal protein S7 [Thermodesulfobacteriota bacterium]RZP13172.1 MAG: 30S ribosomal protein S7 [Candidatus Dadabacteria bacterium]|tara:strand:+ start:463 stop:933 length:471 start_codon:yes stop_codon:yes gene_type:complete